MTDDLLDLQQLAMLARRRAADARALAQDRRRRAAGALAGRQTARAEALLDSACWLDAAAGVEDRRAASLEAQRAAVSRRCAGSAIAPGEGR